MTDLRQAAQHVVDTLEDLFYGTRKETDLAIDALKSALAQPEQAMAHGDIRALKYRIHELEGEVIGYKRIIEEAALKKLADLGQEIEQEPVAWLKEDWTGGHLNYETVYAGDFAAFPVYKHPPAAQPTYPLPDDLYESKDWRAAGNYAERVEWLHVMYESKKQELEAYLDAQRKPLTDEQIEEICWTEVDQRLRSFARAIEAAHGIKEGT